MANLQRLMTSASRFGSVALRREFSLGARACLMAGVNPVPAVLPEVGQELQGLKVKEKGPWKDLSREEKIELYRSTFPLTMIESELEGEPQGKTIMAGVATCVVIATTFFFFLRKYIGPEPPRTINEEWRQATKEKMKVYRMNPISGSGSK